MDETLLQGEGGGNKFLYKQGKIRNINYSAAKTNTILLHAHSNGTSFVSMHYTGISNRKYLKRTTRSNSGIKLITRCVCVCVIADVLTEQLWETTLPSPTRTFTHLHIRGHTMSRISSQINDGTNTRPCM